MKMAEQIPDVELNDQKMEEECLKAFVAEVKQKVEADEEEVDQKMEEDKTKELRACISDLKRKEADKKDCKRFLDAATRVEKDDDESLYRNLFGMAVNYSVDTILKREVLYLTMEMTEFRRSIAQGIASDEVKLEEPFNVVALPKAFQEAWQVWRSGDTEGGRAGRAKASYEVFALTIQQND